MSNTVSDYFTDEDLEQNLRCQFSVNEMFELDFLSVFSQIEDMETFFRLKLKGRVFCIDKVTGAISEEG